MPRITIDIEGFGEAALRQPEAGAIALGPSQPRANAPTAPSELLARAQAEGALNAGPAPSPPAGPGVPPNPFQLFCPDPARSERDDGRSGAGKRVSERVSSRTPLC